MVTLDDMRMGTTFLIEKGTAGIINGDTFIKFDEDEKGIVEEIHSNKQEVFLYVPNEDKKIQYLIRKLKYAK